MKKLIPLFKLSLTFVLMLSLIFSSNAAAKIKLSKTSATLAPGKSITLQLSGTTKKAKWTTSDKLIATVKNGKVTAKKAGTAKITATIGSKKYTCKITVKCDHKKTSIKGKILPTCTSEGYTGDTVCTVCKKVTKKGQKSNPIGHDYSITVADKISPTCTLPGKTAIKKCRVCDDVIGGETLDKNGHLFTVYVSNGINPTCTKDGKTYVSKCRDCNETIGGEPIPALGHTTKGLQCDRCGVLTKAMDQIGRTYTDKNGLNITLNSFTITRTEGYDLYSINYTLENRVPNSKLMEGTFKLFFTDETGESQYGAFDYMYYGDKITRSYSWKVLKTQEVYVLEYNADEPNAGLNGSFFRKTPIADALHWIVY